MKNLLITLIMSYSYSIVFSSPTLAGQKVDHFILGIVLDTSPTSTQRWSQLMIAAERAYEGCSIGDTYCLFTIEGQAARLKFTTGKSSKRHGLNRLRSVLHQTNPHPHNDADIALVLRRGIYRNLRERSSQDNRVIIVVLSTGLAVTQLVDIAEFAGQIRAAHDWGLIIRDSVDGTPKDLLAEADRGQFASYSLPQASGSNSITPEHPSILLRVVVTFIIFLILTWLIYLAISNLCRWVRNCFRNVFARLSKFPLRTQTTRRSRVVQARLPNHRARQTSSTHSGPPQVLELGPIQGSRIVQIGLGSIGSPLFRDLVRTVPLQMHIIDPKIIELKHTHALRTVFEPWEVGQKKVDALKYIATRDSSRSVIEADARDLMQISDKELRTLALNADLLLATFDHPQGLLRLNSLIYDVIEIIYVAGHPRAASGHIIMTAPGISACLHCCLNVESARDIHQLNREPALSLDLRHLTNQAAVVILEILYSKKTGRPITRWDLSRNVWYFANRRDPRLSPDGPAIILRKAQKRPGCRICNPL